LAPAGWNSSASISISQPFGAVVGVPMELGGFGLWAHGVWDAYHRAKSHNLGL